MQKPSNIPPGTEEIQRFLPKLRYELIGCGLNGHELLGTHARHIRAKDHLFVRENEGLRWYRCLRCDSWLPLPLPKSSQITEEFPPDRRDIDPPLRGKPLRDRYVLRVIAIDRAVHVLVLTLLSIVIFMFAAHRAILQADYDKILSAFQGVSGGAAQSGLLSKLQHLFTLSPLHIKELGLIVIAYAALEAAEMVGLWLAKRWAEYLTFVATLLFIPLEVYEIILKPTPLKISALIINVAIALYLLYAKRLFGLRGGGKAERLEREHDTGWPAIERATPKA